MLLQIDRRIVQEPVWNGRALVAGIDPEPLTLSIFMLLNKYSCHFTNIHVTLQIFMSLQIDCSGTSWEWEGLGGWDWPRTPDPVNTFDTLQILMLLQIDFAGTSWKWEGLGGWDWPWPQGDPQGHQGAAPDWTGTKYETFSRQEWHLIQDSWYQLSGYGKENYQDMEKKISG